MRSRSNWSSRPGQAVAFAFTVTRSDLDRLRRQFERIERLAVGLDDPEPAPSRLSE